MASAATLFIDPITFSQMYEREGLPANTILREDDVTWDLWMPTTDLPEINNGSLYPAKLINNGSQVRVVVNGYDLGAIEQNALPEAVEALRAYGGSEAPCYVKGSNIKSRTDSVYVVKPRETRG
jgi:hypothetical protein